MTYPGNMKAFKRKKSSEMLKRLNAKVRGITQQLQAVREVYNEKHPTVQRLATDSINAVKQRSDSVRAVVKRRSNKEE